MDEFRENNTTRKDNKDANVGEDAKAGEPFLQNKNFTTHNYAETFRNWMLQQQWFQQINYVSCYYIASMSYMHHMMSLKEQTSANLVTNQINTNQQITSTATLIRNTPYRGRECEIPSLWKRFLAEIIDFSFLLLLKLGVSLILMDYIDFIDVDAYDLENFFNMNWDPKITANLTTELITIELTNRFCVAIFEALCLKRGTFGSIGGATPGKRMLGLRVVSCNEVVKINNRKVAVYPAANITFFNALLRSFIKNFSFLFFFPMPFTALIFPFKRTAYDIFSGCIVVYVGEEDLNNFRN